MKFELDLLLLISLLALQGCASQGIDSKGGGLDLMIPIESTLAEQSQSVHVFEAKDGEGNRTLVQSSPALLSSPGNRMGRSLVGLVPNGGAGREWSLSEAPEPDSKFSIDQSEEGVLTIREEGTVVLAYRFGRQTPPDVPADRHRSSYIHPIVDTFGSVLTDDFPDDHLHHRGLSWMWPRITIQNQQRDLWHIRGVYQRFEKWLQRESGPVCAAVGIKNTWESDQRTVLDEWVWVRVFAAGKRGRAIDLNLTWQAREEILVQGQEEKGYGGLCFRVAKRKQAVITTPSGRLLKDSDLQPFPWADYSGVFGGNQEPSGVAIFQHSGNLDFPSGWCLRYYGFLGVSWPGVDPYILEPGQPITMRFRIWIHDGDARKGAVEQAYAGFSSLPSVIFQTQTEGGSL